MNIHDLFSAFGVVQEAQGPQSDYLHFASRMAQHAATWAVFSGSGAKCLVRFQAPNKTGPQTCASKAIAPCMVCHHPVCFSHALINIETGKVMCMGCVVEAKERSQDRQPRASEPRVKENQEDLRKKYLKVLGLMDPAEADEIKAAYKKLAAKYHPDKAPLGKREAAHKKFVAINEAYSWLQQNSKEAA